MSNYDKRTVDQLIDKYSKKLQEVTTSWDSAFEKAKSQIRSNFSQKRNALKEKLNKSKASEQEAVEDYQRKDINQNRELEEVSRKINFVESQSHTTQPYDANLNIDRRNHLLDEISRDTQKDITIVLDRHRDKVKRMEQIWAQNAPLQRNYGAGMTVPPTAAAASIKAILDIQKRNMNETVNKLEAIREEIVKKFKELSQLDQKETEELETSEKLTNEREATDRKEEMTKFVNRMKESLKKSKTKDH